MTFCLVFSLLVYVLICKLLFIIIRLISFHNIFLYSINTTVKVEKIKYLILYRLYDFIGTYLYMFFNTCFSDSTNFTLKRIRKILSRFLGSDNLIFDINNGKHCYYYCFRKLLIVCIPNSYISCNFLFVKYLLEAGFNYLSSAVFLSLSVH